MPNNPPQIWFEMPDVRRRLISNGVWIPLRQSETILLAENQEEVICVGTVAIANEHRAIGNQLDWNDIGLIHNAEPYAFSDGRYKPADVYLHNENEAIGVELILVQHVNSAHKGIWRVNQDLVMALGLIEEGNVWVRPDEGYIDVIRCRRDTEGQFVAIEIRAEFLRDYLCARGLALRIASYRQRMAKVVDPAYIEWSSTPIESNTENERFSAQVFEIDADGGPFGGSVAVMKVWRTDVDNNEDVPVFGDETDQNTAFESHTYERSGPKLFRVEGELWRTEWVESATISERVRRDRPTEEFFYLVGAAGEKLPSSALNNEDVGRWLWFRPQVIETLLEHKGSGLGWYTFDTGWVKCSPDYGTHFGVNKVGLINVYAYDIAKLPQWQQRLWVGHNVAPDGQVSSELLDSQMRATPANTTAPEADFEKLLNILNQIFIKRYGGALFRSHDSKDEILRRVHRFRATSKAGLLELAKDIARLTADSIDVTILRAIVKPESDQKLGSLKLMERLLALSVGDEPARNIMTPLVGVYDLRLGDAHLPSSKINEAYTLLKIDVNSHPINQATQVLIQSVNSLRGILSVISRKS